MWKYFGEHMFIYIRVNLRVANKFPRHLPTSMILRVRWELPANVHIELASRRHLNFRRSDTLAVVHCQCFVGSESASQRSVAHDSLKLPWARWGCPETRVSQNDPKDSRRDLRYTPNASSAPYVLDLGRIKAERSAAWTGYHARMRGRACPKSHAGPNEENGKMSARYPMSGVHPVSGTFRMPVGHAFWI